VVVVGQAGAGIASTALVEGRIATVTGIVRRPNPSATDHRFVVTPRFPADVRLAGAPATGSDGGKDAGASHPGDSSGSGSKVFGGADAAASAALDADIIELAAHVGGVVRIGGLVVDLRSDGFSLDDGTAIGRVALSGDALDQLPLIEPDDALNVIGRVETTGDGLVVTVDDPGGIVLTGDPIPAEPSPVASDSLGGLLADPQAGAGSRFAGLGGPSWPVDPGAVGLGMLFAISALSLAVTILRREHARRRLTDRIAARLAAFAGPPGVPPAPSVAERDPSTIHAA
jgi:hypothetical protein